MILSLVYSFVPAFHCSTRYHGKTDRANEIILYLHNIVSSIQWFNLTDASWSGAKAHPDQASVRLNYWYSDRMCVKKVHGLETCFFWSKLPTLRPKVRFPGQ